MHDQAGQEGGDGVALGALLALLHGADAAFDRVEATYRIWRHEERAAAAWQAEIEENKRRGGSITSFALGDPCERPVETEEVLRIWRGADRVRAEHEGGSRDGAYAVRDGDVWWSWDETFGAMSNEDDRSVGYSVGEEISLMLDPTPLLGLLRFTPDGRGRVARQETITADAVPRLRDPRRHPSAFELHQLGSGADRYTLRIDVQRGALLEVVALRDGQPFHRITTVQIAFDHPIAPERFYFQPPPGERIQPTSERHRVVHLSLSEAQQRAPFTVLIPARIPPDWHSHCTFIEPAQRPPSPACVSLNYHSDDGHESVSLSEYAAADAPDQYDLMSPADDWRTVTRDGTDVRVRTLGSQNQAYVERGGTFVFLMAETLTDEQLATLAAGLKPAPSTNSI